MKRKNLFILPLAMFGVLCSVSCGGTKDTTVPDSDPVVNPDDEMTADPLEGKNVTIRFDSQWGQSMNNLFHSWASEFMKLHPSVTVEVNKIQGDYNGVKDKEISDISAGYNQWGDIVSCYPDHCVEYIATGRCVDLMKFVDNDDPNIALGPNSRKDLTGAAKKYFEIKYNDFGMYCAPFAVSTEFMMYNKELLTWTIPGVNNDERITEDYLNDMTWEEFFTVFCPNFMKENARRPKEQQLLITDDGEYSVLGYDSDDNAFISLLEQYGYPYTSVNDVREGSIDFNTPEARQLVKNWNHYRNMNYVITEGTNEKVKPSNGMFASKKCLFAIGSTGGINYASSALDNSGLDIKVGALSIPHAEGHRPAIVLQGGSLCILSHTTEDDADRQLAAWMFYKYITQQKNCIRWGSSTGYAPIRKSVYATSAWNQITKLTDDQGNDKVGISLLTALSSRYVQLHSDEMFLNEVFTGSSVCRQEVGSLFKLLLGKKEAECTDDYIAAQFEQTVKNIKLVM